MYDQQITYLSSNQRRTHMVRFLCCLAVKKIKQHKSVGVLIVCHFLTSQSWRDKGHVSWLNNFISRLSSETKPRPKSWPTSSIVWRRLQSIASDCDVARFPCESLARLSCRYCPSISRWAKRKAKPNCRVMAAFVPPLVGYAMYYTGDGANLFWDTSYSRCFCQLHHFVTLVVHDFRLAAVVTSPVLRHDSFIHFSVPAI